MEAQGFLKPSEIIFYVINWLSIEDKVTKVLVAPSQTGNLGEKEQGLLLWEGSL